MTPEEKGRELIEKYRFEIAGMCINDLAADRASKYAALIAVDEILASQNELFQEGNKNQYLSFGKHATYWKSVKQSIQAL